MTKPIWEELEELSDKLGVEGKLTVQQMKLMRSCAIQLENWFVAVQEIREERDTVREDCKKYRDAMTNMAELMRVGGLYLVKNSHELGDETFARDFAGHINIMGGMHKDPDYGKTGMPRPHVDTRSKVVKK